MKKNKNIFRAFALFVVGVIVVIMKLLRDKKRANRELQKQNFEITNRINILEKQREELPSSIHQTDAISEEIDFLSTLVGVTDRDQEFLAKFNETIKKNIGNSEYNADIMGSEMNYSRTQLYRKIKLLTGESPNRLLHNARLKHADHLLRTTSLTISEIAYESGFSVPSYFSKSYKEMFGHLPSEVER